MRVRLLGCLATLLFICASTSAQFNTPANRVKSAASLPATCTSSTTAKDMIWQNGVGLSVCSALNTWTAVGGGGGTVTSVGNGTIGSLFTVSWANPTTTPALSLDITNQGTTAQVLHGNAAGHPVFGPVVSADMNITTTTCTAPQVVGAIGSNGVGTCVSPSIAQNSRSAAYTTVLGDSVEHIYHPSADTTARTWTIDSNANVAYPIGTTITFVNDCSAGTVTIAITSDTLILAGTGSTGSRTLAACGMATALKLTSTRWIISGTGLS